MRRDLERRLRRLEIADAMSDDIEFWVNERDSMVAGPRGETITREAFDYLQLHGTGAQMLLLDPRDLLL